MTDATARRAPFDPVERDTWEERARRDLGEDVDRLRRGLLDGVTVDPLYTARPDADPGEPGAPPFTRGAQPVPGWAVSHALVGHDPAAIRRSAEAAVEGDADRLWLPREALAALGDEVALREALDGIGVPVDVELGPTGLAWIGPLTRLGGAWPQLDPWACLARDGSLPAPMEEVTRWLTALVAASAVDSPADSPSGARPALVDARVHHESGAGASLELGAALATGLAHLRALSAHGHPLADAPRRVSFTFAVDGDLFVSIAKLRAARELWSKALRALGVDGPEQGARVHAFASLRERTRLGHHTNLLRETVAAFGAAVGGAERVTLAPYEPGPHGERLARNAQLMLKHESHLDAVIDAAGGSYYVEHLTDALARAGWAEMQRLEAEGGMTAALTSGAWAARVAEAREARREALERGDLVRVGVNRYPAEATLEAASSEPLSERLSEPPTPPLAEDDARPEKAARDAVRDAAPPELGRVFAASDAPVARLATELVRGRDPVAAPSLPPFRDAAEREAAVGAPAEEVPS